MMWLRSRIFVGSRCLALAVNNTGLPGLTYVSIPTDKIELASPSRGPKVAGEDYVSILAKTAVGFLVTADPSRVFRTVLNRERAWRGSIQTLKDGVGEAGIVSINGMQRLDLFLGPREVTRLTDRRPSFQFTYACREGVFDREWEYQMAHNPVRASLLDDRRWNDQWADVSLGTIHGEYRHAHQVLNQWRAICRAQLAPQDQIRYDVFDYNLGEYA